MSVHQWFVITLNVAAFLAMVIAFAVTGRQTPEPPGDDSDFPPLDYRAYRKI